MNLDVLTKDLEIINQEIAIADRDGNTKRMAELVAELQEINRKIALQESLKQEPASEEFTRKIFGGQFRKVKNRAADFFSFLPWVESNEAGSPTAHIQEQKPTFPREKNIDEILHEDIFTIENADEKGWVLILDHEIVPGKKGTMHGFARK